MSQSADDRLLKPMATRASQTVPIYAYNQIGVYGQSRDTGAKIRNFTDVIKEVSRGTGITSRNQVGGSEWNGFVRAVIERVDCLQPYRAFWDTKMAPGVVLAPMEKTQIACLRSAVDHKLRVYALSLSQTTKDAQFTAARARVDLANAVGDPGALADALADAANAVAVPDAFDDRLAFTVSVIFPELYPAGSITAATGYRLDTLEHEERIPWMPAYLDDAGVLDPTKLNPKKRKYWAFDTPDCDDLQRPSLVEATEISMEGILQAVYSAIPTRNRQVRELAGVIKNLNNMVPTMTDVTLLYAANHVAAWWAAAKKLPVDQRILFAVCHPFTGNPPVSTPDPPTADRAWLDVNNFIPDPKNLYPDFNPEETCWPIDDTPLNVNGWPLEHHTAQPIHPSKFNSELIKSLPKSAAKMHFYLWIQQMRLERDLRAYQLMHDHAVSLDPNFRLKLMEPWSCEYLRNHPKLTSAVPAAPLPTGANVANTRFRPPMYDLRNNKSARGRKIRDARPDDTDDDRNGP